MLCIQPRIILATGVTVAMIAGLSHPATAQKDVMKLCGEQWQEVKKKNKGEAPKGLTWKKFLSDCRKRETAAKPKAAIKKSTTRTSVRKSAANATSSQDVMKVCGAEWQKVKGKNGGKAPKGATWSKFLSDCRKRKAGGLKTTKAAASKSKSRATKAKASGDSMMAVCGSEWRGLKEKKKVPKGMTWTKFLDGCSKRYADKFEPTPKQRAMYVRIRKCGAMWREAKDKGRLKKNATWPKYWSACNKRLTRSN